MALVENMIRADGTIGPVNKVEIAVKRLKAVWPAVPAVMAEMLFPRSVPQVRPQKDQRLTG